MVCAIAVRLTGRCRAVGPNDGNAARGGASRRGAWM